MTLRTIVCMLLLLVSIALLDLVHVLVTSDRVRRVARDATGKHKEGGTE